MLRSPRFLAGMVRLALAAILLMAVMPTVSRWLASSMPTEAAPTHDMAGMAGMMVESHHHHAGNVPAPAPAPSPHEGMQHDVCAYCPLLASLAPILLLALVLLPPSRQLRLPLLRDFAPHTTPLLLGLGARGPPISL